MLNFNEFSNITKTDKITETKPTKTTSATEKKEINQPQTVLINNPSNNTLINKKGRFALTLAITATLSAGVAFAISGRKINRLSSELRRLADLASTSRPSQELAEAQRQLSELRQKDSNTSELIAQLQEKIKKLSKLVDENKPLPPEILSEVEAKTNKYKEIISGVTSIYEDAQPPTKDGKLFTIFKIPFPQRKSNLPHGDIPKNNFINDLIDRLRIQKKIELPLTKKSSTPETIQRACIKPEDMAELSKPQRTSIKVEYGKKVQWSDEKVARDILQNFYDGNNHSLDDIGFIAEQLPNGNYRIKISGNGVFNYDRLRLLGDSTKTEDLADAGGFGEGAKVVIANLLAKGNAEEITFRSADWELVFDGKGSGEVIRTTLNKQPQILDGNCIEFETKDKNLAEKIIEALNYFNHKNNPDFQNLTYEGENFGLRILNPDQKGNFYLTQRFEFGKKGAWNNEVEGLNIIFKKRPDPKKYQEITGHALNTGRDRAEMTVKDIYELTKCFSSDMSDEELRETIIATKPFWQNFQTNLDTPIKSLLKALLEEAEKRGVGFDFNDAKICTKASFVDKAVYEHIASCGYQIIPAEDIPFHKIGMPNVRQIHDLLSGHKAITPTEVQAKKLKVLEEATGVLQKYFSKTYITKLKNIMRDIKPEDLKIDSSDYRIGSLISSFKDLEFSPGVCEKRMFGKKLEIIDTDKFNAQLYDFIQNKIKTLNISNFEDEESKNLIELISSILEKNKNKNKLFEQYSTQLRNINIIATSDVRAPRFIFDRKNEPSTNTLGEAITDYSKGYMGHWVDKTYLDNASFHELLATWLHEICHKSGGDGTAEFTYKLTDMIESLLNISTKQNEYQSDLIALQKIFEELK